MLENMLNFALFFLPGIALCYLLFPKIELMKRVVFSILLAISVSCILGISLYCLQQFSPFTMVIGELILLFVFIVIVLIQNKRLPQGMVKFETPVNKDLVVIAIFSGIGTLVKFWFFNSISNSSDPYEYAFRFVGKAVPDLGFYTGMAADRVSYIGLSVMQEIQNTFLTQFNTVHYFLITFLFLGLVYSVFLEYRQDRKLALIAVALLSFGPIELFHTMISLTGHSLSYLILLPFFLYFKSKEKNIFWICFLLSLVMMTTYYTASITIILASVGFRAALIVKKRHYGEIDRSKLVGFLLITLVLIGNVYASTELWRYSIGRLLDGSSLNNSIHLVSSMGIVGTEDTLYRNPTFLGLSAIRWQAVFFLICGMTFVAYMSHFFWQRKKRKLSEPLAESDTDLLLCLIPVALVSFAFFYVNLSARIFDYFSFFGLLALTIPKKRYAAFTTISVLFILITGFYVARDTRVFYELPPKETEAAKWVSGHLHGTVFADMVFANQLISQKYYNVTGAADNDKLIKSLFYQNNKEVFMKAVSHLRTNDVSYITVTKRMKDSYVLMVNYPQRAIDTSALFDTSLPKVFDNGDVEIYSATSSISTTTSL